MTNLLGFYDISHEFLLIQKEFFAFSRDGGPPPRHHLGHQHRRQRDQDQEGRPVHPVARGQALPEPPYRSLKTQNFIKNNHGSNEWGNLQLPIWDTRRPPCRRSPPGSSSTGSTWPGTRPTPRGATARTWTTLAPSFRPTCYGIDLSCRWRRLRPPCFRFHRSLFRDGSGCSVM